MRNEGSGLQILAKGCVAELRKRSRACFNGMGLAMLACSLNTNVLLQSSVIWHACCQEATGSNMSGKTLTCSFFGWHTRSSLPYQDCAQAVEKGTATKDAENRFRTALPGKSQLRHGVYLVTQAASFCASVWESLPSQREGK